MSQMQKFNQNDLDALTKPKGQFLPRIDLCANTSRVFTEARIVNPGQFFLAPPNDKLKRAIILGQFAEEGADGQPHGALEVTIGPARSHAIHIANNEVADESFDIRDPVFKQIRACVDGKVKEPGHFYKYGVDILFYIDPDQINWDTCKDKEFLAEAKETYANGIWGTFFFGNTAAQYAKPLYQDGVMGSKVRIISSIIVTPTFNWWSPNVLEWISNKPNQALLESAQDAANVFNAAQVRMGEVIDTSSAIVD